MINPGFWIMIELYKLKHNFDKLYFIFESAKSHSTPKVLDHLENNNNIEAIIVPYHELWQKWFISNENSYTKHNYMRFQVMLIL